MEYRIAQGREHKLVLSSNIYQEDQFMYQAYMEAQNALSEIVTYSDEIKTQMYDEEALFESLQNIIAFSGKRGQGKTSTMLSFSNTLKYGKLRNSNVAKYSYEVLEPIDPTILEENQNILALILSRMYRRAESVWSKNTGNGFRYPNGRLTEAHKNDLLKSFQICLNGINVIKCKKDREIKSLTDISVISDSATLKKDLYDLIQKYLRFVSDMENPKDYLVIQLDDTDFQVNKGYEILEDLRKFLSIPNVIILMATDLSMLRTVVLQHYIRVFGSGLGEKIVDIEKLAKIESKYMDKIVPPVHAIHLPKLEEYVLRYGNKMNFIYEDKEKHTNILYDEVGAGDNALLSPQELILRYIYRKTGIVFVSDPASYHGFIPTTLRGLAQMLSLLNTLEDIPEIPLAQMHDTALLIEAEKNRARIVEHNIARFEKYFLNEWVGAKLSHAKAEWIQELAKVAPSERVSHAMTILNKDNEKDNKGALRSAPTGKVKYADFMYQLQDLINNNQENKDATFILAVQTWFTIANHKTVLKQIKNAIDNYSKGVLVFDFSPANTYLPSMYLSPRILENGANKVLIESNLDVDQKRFMHIVGHLFQNYRVAGKTKTCFSYLHIVSIIQSLGHKDLKAKLNEQTPQEFLYQSQMTVAMLISNLEVQLKVSSALEAYKGIGAGAKEDSESLSKGMYSEIQKTLDSINREAADAPIMANSKFYDIQNFKNRSDLYGMTDAVEILKEMDALFDSKPQLMDRLVYLYRSSFTFAKTLKKYKNLSPVYPIDAENFGIDLDNFLAECQAFYREVTNEKVSDLFNLRGIELGVTSQESFRSRFNARYEKLCAACNIDFKAVKNEAKGAAWR